MKTEKKNKVQIWPNSWFSPLNQYLIDTLRAYGQGRRKDDPKPQLLQATVIQVTENKSLTYEIFLVPYCAQLIYAHDSNKLIALKEPQHLWVGTIEIVNIKLWISVS